MTFVVFSLFVLYISNSIFFCKSIALYPDYFLFYSTNNIDLEIYDNTNVYKNFYKYFFYRDYLLKIFVFKSYMSYINGNFFLSIVTINKSLIYFRSNIYFTYICYLKAINYYSLICYYFFNKTTYLLDSLYTFKSFSQYFDDTLYNSDIKNKILLLENHLFYKISMSYLFSFYNLPYICTLQKLLKILYISNNYNLTVLCLYKIIIFYNSLNKKDIAMKYFVFLSNLKKNILHNKLYSLFF